MLPPTRDVTSATTAMDASTTESSLFAITSTGADLPSVSGVSSSLVPNYVFLFCEVDADCPAGEVCGVVSGACHDSVAGASTLLASVPFLVAN